MKWTEEEQNNFFTVNKSGFVERIVDLDDKANWLSSIESISEELEFGAKNRRILPLFRGESWSMFAKKTGHGGVSRGGLPYFDRFFVIGSKAKSYLKDKDFASGSGRRNYLK